MPYSREQPAPSPPDALLVSVRQAAAMLALTVPTMRALLDQELIESRYVKSRRMVVVASMHDYIDGLPSARRA